MVAQLEAKCSLKIYWNYFATSHGEVCVDGIVETVKMVVRKHLRARDVIVNWELISWSLFVVHNHKL